MACTSLPKSPLPLLQAPYPKSPPSQLLPILPKSSHSQFHGLKLAISSPLTSSPPPIPSKTCIAKVSKGSAPPSFTLKDQDGKSVALSKFKGKPVVVYFYPADESPGCTKEACAFRDSYEKFKKAGAEVVGISGDDPASHKAFAKKYRLPFTLLSDEGNKVRKEWGVPSDLFGTLPGRETYVLDRNGVVQLVYNNQFQPEKHAFAKKYRLPFTLLSDEGNKVRKEWGVPSDLFGTLPGRETYVLDRNGVVQLVYNNQFQPEKHVDETLKLLQSL